ncbi:hypothetical protein [Mesorhizobium sp. CAU 1741]|uniref:alpha/beta hydrolase family protein n=1 Tax=Mesorhizobium sp. CAU 1741 TaxID=3140366 RepID=UPI00325B706F
MSAGAAYVSDAGSRDTVEIHDVLADDPVVGAQRPLTCRWPVGGPPAGLVLFCHGLGSSGLEYAALSQHWAGHGYLVVHPTFRDSIDAVARDEPLQRFEPQADLSRWTTMPEVRARLHEILHSPDYWLSRLDLVRAVMAALPQILEATCGRQVGPLPAAIAGHSFGAYTAQLLAGAEIDMPDGRAHRFRDERFRAAVLLSAQGRDQQGLRDGSWDAIGCPMLNVTGTLDRGAKGGDWRWKSEPFELAPPGEKYLAVLEEADHFLGGFTDRGIQATVPSQQDAVKQMTLAFLDEHLRGSEAARIWLASIDNSIGDCRLLFRSK